MEMTMEMTAAPSPAAVKTPPRGTDAYLAHLREREAALGLAGDSPAQRLTRAHKAMADAFWNLEMAEKRAQPARVLDQMEARYFDALNRYEATVLAALV